MEIERKINITIASLEKRLQQNKEKLATEEISQFTYNQEELKLNAAIDWLRFILE